MPAAAPALKARSADVLQGLSFVARSRPVSRTTSRLNITYLATAQLASTQKAWRRPDDGQLVLALFGTETPCHGPSPNARIMFFAAAIGGRSVDLVLLADC